MSEVDIIIRQFSVRFSYGKSKSGGSFAARQVTSSNALGTFVANAFLHNPLNEILFQILYELLNEESRAQIDLSMRYENLSAIKQAFLPFGISIFTCKRGYEITTATIALRDASVIHDDAKKKLGLM